MRRALPLALLLALPAVVAQGPACTMSLPSLAVVCAPQHVVGDSWSYHSRFPALNNTSVEQNETLRVAALEDLRGTPAERLVSFADQSVPARGEGVAATDHRSTNNRTSWTDRATHAVLRIEHEQSETESNPFFRVLTVTWTNWSFHEPQNLYKFPLVKGDEWVVVTNVTVTKEVTIFSHVAGGNQSRVERPRETENLTRTEGKQWLREERGLKTPAGTFDAIVVAGRSGNVTLFDFYAPAAGQLVRREFFSQNGTFLGATELTAYRFQNAPGVVERPPPSGAVDARLVGAAVAAGLLAGLLGVALWRRRAALQRVGAPPEPAPPEPAPSEPSPPAPPSPPEPPG